MVTRSHYILNQTISESNLDLVYFDIFLSHLYMQVQIMVSSWFTVKINRGVYSSMNFDSFPPTFSDLIFFPILYYISLKGLYLIVLLWHSIFGVLCPMGANGGIDKHRQKEMKFWRKFQCFKFRSKSRKN